MIFRLRINATKKLVVSNLPKAHHAWHAPGVFFDECIEVVEKNCATIAGTRGTRSEIVRETREELAE